MFPENLKGGHVAIIGRKQPNASLLTRTFALFGCEVVHGWLGVGTL